MKTKEFKTSSKKNNNSPFFNAKSGDGFIGIQPKLIVGKPGDKYEQEADQVADQVVKNSSNNKGFFGNDGFFSQSSRSTSIQEKPLAETISSMVQRQEEEEEAQPKLIQRQEEEEEMMQMQPMEEEEESLQTKPNGSEADVTSSVENQLKSNPGNGQNLDSITKAEMENSFGADLSSVKIHTGSHALQMNDSLGAQAFTHGNDIYFNSGKYNPGSAEGKHLLAHELTHTIQQNSPELNPFLQKEDAPATTTVETEVDEETCDEATQRAKEAFINHGVYGPQSVIPPSTRRGGFEASYNPASQILQVTVRGNTRFINGLEVNGAGVVSANDPHLAELARLLNYIGDSVLSNTVVSNYYTWNETQRNEATTNLRARIQETIGIWQDDPFIWFSVDEPCWDDIEAFLNISIDVQDVGIADYSNATDPTNDHLQVSLVKNPERSEMRTVRSYIRETAERIGNSREESIDTSVDLTTGARVDSNRFGSGLNSNPYDTEMVLSNNALTNRPGEIQNYRSKLRRSIFFRSNESVLDNRDKRTIDTFITDFQEADRETENSNVTLIGHASILGSTSANRRLVQLRLASVMAYLREKGFTNIDSRVQLENRSDLDAERYSDTSGNAALFRRVDIIIGEGGLQNTVAHEFGHVFGLLDEYVTEDTSFSGTGTAAGTEVGHSDMAEDISAGRALSENSDNIMSLGNEVREQHYGSFGWALRHLTGKDWKIA